MKVELQKGFLDVGRTIKHKRGISLTMEEFVRIKASFNFIKKRIKVLLAQMDEKKTEQSSTECST